MSLRLYVESAKPSLNGCTSMGAAYLLRRYSCGAHPHRVTTRSATCLNVPGDSCSAQLECEMVSGIAIAGHRPDWAAWAALACDLVDACHCHAPLATTHALLEDIHQRSCDHFVFDKARRTMATLATVGSPVPLSQEI